MGKVGILNNNKSEGGWRYYSIMDIIWIAIIKRLRQFGIGLDSIFKVKQSLAFRINQLDYAELEFYTALAYLNRTPVFVLIFSNFTTEVATATEIIDSEDKYGLLNYISINLNGIIQGLFPEKECKPIYKDLIEITDVNKEIIETLAKNKVEEIKLSVRNGIAVKMDFTISEPTDSNIGQLKVKNAFQTIEVKQHDSKTTSIKTTISKKLK